MSKTTESIWTIIVYCLVSIAIGTVFVLLAWNVGVVGLAAALGLVVLRIGFWTSFGGYFLFKVLGNFFKTTDFSETKKGLKL